MGSIGYLQYSFFLKSVPFVLLVTITMTLILLRNYRATILVRSLFFFLAGSSVFLLNNTLEQLAQSECWTSFFAALNYPLIAGLPSLWLIFIMNYTGRKFPSAKWQYAVLFGNSVIATVLAFTNSSHHLIWKSIEYARIGNILVMRVDHGFWFWVTSVLAYGTVIYASAIFLNDFIKPHNIFRKQHMWMFTGIIITLTANIVYIFRIVPGLRKDFTPIAFCFTGILFTVSVLRYRFLELVPVSRALLLDLLDDGIVVFDLEGKIVDINVSAREITGCGIPAIGLDISSLEECWDSPEKIDFRNIDSNGIEATRTVDRLSRYYRIKKNSLYSNGSKIGNVCTITDVTRQTLLYRQVKNMAETDFLTGLCNYRSFLVRGNTELQRSVRSRKPLALAIFDIDYFKVINDTYGHLAGDLVLKTIASVVKTYLREYDIFARIGGDEFAVMMPETDLESARIVSQRIVEKVREKEINIGNTSITVSISMGLNAAAGENLKRGVTLERIMTEADRALYAAKASGRNCLSCSS